MKPSPSFNTTNYSLNHEDRPKPSPGETQADQKKKDNSEEDNNDDWRNILKRLNQSVKQVEQLPKIPDKDPIPKEEAEAKNNSQRDFVDIKLGKHHFHND